MNAAGEPAGILLLGGTSDIGLATVRRLAGPNLRRLVLAGRDPAALERAAVALALPGVDVEVVAFDAAAVSGHAAFVDDVFDRDGDLDCVLVCFGVLGDQSAMEADPAEAVALVTVNYTGVVSVGLHVSRRLRTQGHGTLVLLSSAAGQRARRANFVYGSSKAGADAFAQGLGDALVGSGARVLVVRPGFVHTSMTVGREPAPLSVGPDDVAVAIARGLARDAETVWVPATLRWLMAVMRHLPRGLFRRVTGDR